jgi:hypothetical protein
LFSSFWAFVVSATTSPGRTVTDAVVPRKSVATVTDDDVPCLLADVIVAAKYRMMWVVDMIRFSSCA